MIPCRICKNITVTRTLNPTDNGVDVFIDCHCLKCGSTYTEVLVLSDIINVFKKCNHENQQL